MKLDSPVVGISLAVLLLWLSACRTARAGEYEDLHDLVTLALLRANPAARFYLGASNTGTGMGNERLQESSCAAARLAPLDLPSTWRTAVASLTVLGLNCSKLRERILQGRRILPSRDEAVRMILDETPPAVVARILGETKAMRRRWKRRYFDVFGPEDSASTTCAENLRSQRPEDAGNG